jgi:hypothetical protein
MAKRKSNRAVVRLANFVQRLANRVTKRLATWMLRMLLLVSRYPQVSQRGFILPTTVLLLMVVSLTVGAITLRTLNRTVEATGERQSQVIYNAATPAIDRAKAKLEFMFNRQRDTRLPTGVPGEAQLLGMLANDGRDRNGLIVPPLRIDAERDGVTVEVDPYTFPDEEETAADFLGLSAALDVDGNNRADRLDLDGDGIPDNAWAYRVSLSGDVDANGDPIMDATVAYSILLQTPADPADIELASDAAVIDRANAMQVRHGPLSNGGNLSEACQADSGETAAPIEEGWFADTIDSSTLRKNFQINAFVLPDNLNGTVASVEVHQDRELAQGNKWGAWFRNDLEIFPGPEFNWNGAMHTEGNLIVGNNNFQGYLVSAPASCLYTREASEITITDIQANPEQGIPAFQGQIMSARINDDSFGYRSIFHLYDTNPVTTGDDNVRLDRNRDSVNNGGGDPDPSDYALDPIDLFTQDISRARGTADPSASRDPDWNDQDKKFVSEGRIYNQQEDAPFLDDFYRADNRYGPKPRYSGRRIPGNIGEPITGNLMAANGLSDNDLTNIDADPVTNVGLDGYWERRALREGMRLIVGQRLELGDADGWGTDINNNGELDNDIDDDLNGFADEREVEPIYPPSQCLGDRCHETLQRRTLYDNLAAVQSMVVYHNAHINGEFPAACYALTAHPGTSATIENSRTFDTVTVGATPFVYTDFLSGQGTNGWEFDPPAGVDNNADFANAIAPNQPLGIALRNLAHFSGDPLGGAPSFTPVQDANVHPYPNLTMWGDYSILRRVLAMVDGGTAAEGNPTGGTIAYADLSPADQSTLQTAACTLGMLAYNLDLDQGRYEDLFRENEFGTETVIADFGQLFWELIDGITSDDGDGSNEEIYELITSRSVLTPEEYIDDKYDTDPNTDGDYVRTTHAAEYYEQFSTPDYVEALINKSGHALTEAQIRRRANVIIKANQIFRDRQLGFKAGGFSVDPSDSAPSSDIRWNPDTREFTEGLTSETLTLRTDCDPDLFGTPTNIAISGADSDIRDERKIGLAMAFCSSFTQPKYPSLYYLFPTTDHEHLGEDGRVAGDADDNPNDDDDDTVNLIEVDHRQPMPVLSTDPIIEEYLSDTYIFDDSTNSGVNFGYTYREVAPENLVLTPHRINFSNWVVPTQDSGINEVYAADGTTLASVSFMDKGIYNGREMMGVRVLDIDWGLLHDNDQNLGNDPDGNLDHWLPNMSMVYGVREDAVREDAINRPIGAGAAWGLCGSNATFARTGGPNNGICRMEADPANPQDPPLYDVNQISPKSVDYYADPLRRPNGFRMRNGSELNRPDDQGSGLSFIADVPVYIQGDLNLHQTPGCDGAENCRLEEFTQKLPVGRTFTINEFYNNRTELDLRFASPTQDLWRPTEILADAVSILSDNYCDGSIEDSFVTAGDGGGARISDSETRYGCSGNSDRTSYLDQNRPDEDIAGDGFDWVRSNPDDPTSPIVVSRNGMPLITDGSSTQLYSDEYAVTDFYRFQDNKPLINASENRVNAMIISGLVPSRNDQAYGGMHNFPRFLENWRRLYISGGLLQLNFSNYATAPFDQDAWETDQDTTGDELIRYYTPPNRLWGYDVALQYSPAGPIAARFITPRAIRSEFYTEPAADDQYNINLCNQIAANPATQCATTPGT